MPVEAAIDEADRRRAIWVWPSLVVCGFWIPVFLLVSRSVPPGALARRHATRALQLYAGLVVVDLAILALAPAAGASPALVGVLLGSATAVFLILGAVGLRAARRAPVAAPVAPAPEPASDASEA